RRPLVAIAMVIAVLGMIAVPALSLTLGLPDDGVKAKNTTERRSYDLLSRGFGPGFTGPLTVVIDATGQQDPGQIATEASASLRKFPGVAAASEPAFNQTGRVAIILVTPRGSPSSQATKDLVSALRAKAAEIRRQSGIDAMVTGTTAINIDTSNKLN